MVNPNFKLLPTIILIFDFNCKIDENLYDKLKEEISEIIDKKNFSIIEIQKGSSIAKIILINELAKNGIKASKNQQTSDEIKSVIKKIENKKFACLGNNNPSNSKYNIPDYSQEDNRKKLVNFLKNSKENEDILFATSTIKDEDFDNMLDSLISNISDQVLMQEINQKIFVLNNLENFNNQIESIIEEKKKESIFEFGLTGISLIDRNKDNYENNKNNCNNVITKFLFHGTSTDVSTLITTTNFIKANTAFFGPGIYMTDMLDYAGFYAYETGSKFGNHHRIRKVDETFSIVASQIYYNNSKFENCYEMNKKVIQDEGIRYIHVNAFGRPLSQNQTKENGYKNFIGTEFVIPSEKQILPLYAITLKRNEYYCLYKDYHFTHQTEYTEHAIHIKNLTKQLLGINMYGVGEVDEALNIIKRKNIIKLF